MQRTAKYFITFTPKCFALAVAAISAELRAILLNKIFKKFYNFCAVLLFLRATANYAHVDQFCTKFCVHKILLTRTESQNFEIINGNCMAVVLV